jgi:hypothetical protein
MMKQSLTHLTIAGLLGGALGCSFAARDAEMYRNDTRALLETKNAEIKQCYDETLKTDPTASGSMAVRFTVQSETGRIVDASIDTARTTAPDALGVCVARAISTLALTPPDANDGQATFVYEFTVGPAPAPAPASPEPPPPG